MDFYCRQFRFDKPIIESDQVAGGWETTMTVGGRKIGVGTGTNKKSSVTHCYLDVVQYLESCDPSLWKTYVQKARTGNLPGHSPTLRVSMSTTLSNELRDLCVDARKTMLYRNSPAPSGESGQDSFIRSYGRSMRPLTQEGLVLKSQALQKQRQKYLADPKMEVMRKTRMALPVHSQKNQLLSMIEDNVVLVCMATTGSGKTTQIPQIILDEWIDQGRGGECNILCTQPRRLAALSVADRVAKERGESLGQTVGFQVRFESQPPEDHGSITFCTTGVFLKKLQTALSENVADGYGQLDHITHVVVDEVHERDVDTDLLLAVLKRLINVRKARKNPIKVILMSATIDPSLFQSYFADVNDGPAKVIDIPGRSFPVNKYFMDDFIPKLVDSPMKWVFNEETVAKYVGRELGDSSPLPMRQYRDALLEDELDIPYTLVAAMISYVLHQSDSGHVLVFLPGWDDIVAVQRQLQNPPGPWTTNFNDRSKISLHLLHSSIPLAEQQVIFDPPAPGIRRVILSTNIAETSVTIPDVVYVVDTARLKEQRFDPERHIMSLVSAWVGSSNLNQRAGRAGRHRSGDYFGLLSRQHAAALQPYQTVEMSRVDLSNVVMHVKALNFPQMTVEEVLEGTIEPPSSDRVAAAMTGLQMVGALDQNNNLTSLGHVLLQLPVDVQVGRLVLYGSFFRCLDQSLTLAAILTNREPWVAPMHIKLEAGQKKSSWAPENFRSDPLATLQAYNAWEEMQIRREYNAASRFCIDNFLARPTLLMIQKIKTHLLQSLFHAGVLQVSGGGDLIDQRDRLMSIPSQMNENGHCLPLLAALIASASQPKFAVRFGEKGFRTQQEKVQLSGSSKQI
jgi:small subunit ribosomal protein S24e